MNRFSGAFTVSLTLLALSNQQAAAQTRDRSQVDPQYQWQLEDIYPTTEAWAEAREALAEEFDTVLQYRGQLSGSAGPGPVKSASMSSVSVPGALRWYDCAVPGGVIVCGAEAKPTAP